MSQLVKELYEERLAGGDSPPSELIFYNRGYQNCPSGHYHISVRNYFLVHVVLAGKGWFHLGNTRVELGAGQGFTMFPYMVGEYQADEKEPWTYCWIGFQGALAAYHLQDLGIMPNHPCFTLHGPGRSEEIRDLLTEQADGSRGDGQNYAVNPLEGRGIIYRFLGVLSRDLYGRESLNNVRYVHEAIDFVKKNFSQPIRVTDMARAAGVDRTYLYSLFKEHTGKTPKEYLTDFRLKAACELLESRNLSVKAAARSVGYEDELNFSRVFSQKLGVSPSRWGASNRSNS